MSSQQLLRSVPARILAALVLLLVGNVGAAGAAGLTALPSCEPAVRFERRAFSHPTRIDNRFLPTAPGTQWVLEGRASRTGTPLPHQVVFTVTDLTKQIDGVPTVVVWDVDSGDGVVQEAELSFWAQDDAGNVWNLGEYPEEYDGRVFVGAPRTWIAGMQRAQAGIHMLADPRVGTPPYSQGLAPAVDFHDCAQVFKRGLHVAVPFGRYDHVLAINEWDPAQPGMQRKFHAPGVGIIQVTAVNDPEGEDLVLTDRKQLDTRAMTEARRETLRLDRHGRRTNDLYRQTAPLEPNSGI